MPVPPTSHDRRHRALLILLLLARAADLPAEQVVSAHTRALAVRGLRRTAREHRTTWSSPRRAWTCPVRRPAGRAAD